MDLDTQIVDQLIDLALLEDHVADDITTNSLLEFDNPVTASVTAKASGIISGIDVFMKVMARVDEKILFSDELKNGSQVSPGDKIISIRGNESAILKAERTALNFIQRLSGVASLTAEYVRAIEGTGVKLLDTRKTTPGMRLLQKRAVLHGGGHNHRLHLADMAMIKDNHILMAGSIENAVNKIRQLHPEKRIELEVKNIAELKTAYRLNVDIVMLDNFSDQMLREGLLLDKGETKIEISGNVTLETIRSKALSGVDYISVGALTHSYKALDLSLNIERN